MFVKVLGDKWDSGTTAWTIACGWQKTQMGRFCPICLVQENGSRHHVVKYARQPYQQVPQRPRVTDEETDTETLSDMSKVTQLYTVDLQTGTQAV